MSRPLSVKQQNFLDFVRRYALENGEPPTYEEIRDGLGLTSLGTVNWYVTTLVQAGFLLRAKGPNGKRALQLAGATATPAQLPLLGVIAAGAPIAAVENRESLEVPARLAHPENYVLQVRGDSMIDDNIQDGDFVVIRKTADAQTGQTVVALINGDATLKRYHPRPGGVELHPRNPAYPVIKIDPNDDFRINGVVLFVFRQY
ncbi:MAG: transcriptional repressor LexA [Candidatus Neomarinimicrobiota bacterium]